MANRWNEFKVPGKIEWDRYIRERLARQVNTVAAVSRIFIWEENGVAVVLNQPSRNPNGSTKELGWGLPTETVGNGNVPLKIAKDTGRRELNLAGKIVEIDEKPILVNTTTNENGEKVIHFLFNALLEPYTDIPKNIADEDGEVTRAIILDPNQIVVPEPGQGKPYFMLDGEKQIIYPSHVAYIAWGYNMMTKWAHTQTR